MKVDRFMELAEQIVKPQDLEVETFYYFTRRELVDLFLLVRKEIINELILAAEKKLGVDAL